MSLARHARAWLRPAAWQRLAAVAEDAAMRAAFETWSLHDWPLVVRRQDAGPSGRERMPGARIVPAPRAVCTVHDATDAADPIALGLALPAAEGRRRIGVIVAAGDVARHAPALTLRAALPALTAPWKASVEHIDAAARAHAVAPRVFGALAWQAATGRDYLRAGSDVDLCCAVDSRATLRRAEAWLQHAGRVQSLPLDVELQFPDGNAVSAREWRNADRGASVLAKRVDGVRLVRRAVLLDALPAEALA